MDGLFAVRAVDSATRHDIAVFLLLNLVGDPLDYVLPLGPREVSGRGGWGGDVGVLVRGDSVSQVCCGGGGRRGGKEGPGSAGRGGSRLGGCDDGEGRGGRGGGLGLGEIWRSHDCLDSLNCSHNCQFTGTLDRDAAGGGSRENGGAELCL